MADEHGSRRALIIVDMLEDFVGERGSLYCGPRSRQILPTVERRLAEARKAGTRVFFVCDRHTPDDPEFQMFPPHCIAGTAGAEVCPELRPRPGEVVIPKRRYSAFYGTDLDLHLREAGIEHLDVAGVCTNICVLYTAADARMRGYGVTIFRDGVASFDEDAHRFALDQMEKVLGAEVL